MRESAGFELHSDRVGNRREINLRDAGAVGVEDNLRAAAVERRMRVRPVAVAAEGFAQAGVAASLDAKWIVADTNWPDIGIQLIHVASRLAAECQK